MVIFWGVIKPQTRTNLSYYNDCAALDLRPSRSVMQLGLWCGSHVLALVALVSARPGWLLGSGLFALLVYHAWARMPRWVSALRWGVDGQFWVEDLPDPMVLCRGDLGPWHVYLQLEGPVGGENLCIYKDALPPAAWSALRRRLLSADAIG